MVVAVFLPFGEKDDASAKIPSLLYLSGLTCTDENVCQKGGLFKKLSEHKIALIAPDTSPRGAGIEGEDESWDFGTGAGFYLDATQEKWSKNYRMYAYVTRELMSTLDTYFPCLDASRRSITGHSMGGLGALTIALKNPQLFRSVSAFSPICHPTVVPWGQKAFENYLGTAQESWALYDPTLLISEAGKASLYDDILIDVGSGDPFLENQLKPEDFIAAAETAGQKVTFRMQPGYDHGYFFISTFADDHVAFHAQRLQ